MDLEEQLKALFPNHKPESTAQGDTSKKEEEGIWIQEEPLLCKYEKRQGKPTLIIEGYTGAKEDFKKLAQEIKSELGIGGSIKDEKIILQGDVRQKVMQILKEYGFKVKRVGG